MGLLSRASLSLPPSWEAIYVVHCHLISFDQEESLENTHGKGFLMMMMMENGETVAKPHGNWRLKSAAGFQPLRQSMLLMMMSVEDWRAGSCTACVSVYQIG